MKSINIVILFLAGICHCFGQVSGETQSGKLFPTKDDVPPVIQLTSPSINHSDTIVVIKESLLVKGIITDESRIKSLQVNNDIVSLENNDFTVEVKLKIGYNLVTIKAIDEFNNSMQILINASYQIDSFGPSIVLKTPDIILNEKQTIDAAQLKLEFTTEDDTRVKDVFVNGEIMNVNEDRLYSIDLPLVEGKNVFYIKAVDELGNISSNYIYLNNLADLTGPEIIILEPKPQRGIKVVHKSEVVTIKGIAKDTSGIHKVIVNNREAELGIEGTFVTAFYLELGDNQIVVEAIDSKFNETIDTFWVERKQDEIISAGKYVGVLIGINEYEGSYWEPLNSAVNDANKFGKLLEEQYNFDSLIYIIDQEATRENIVNKLETLTDTSWIKKDDNVLIFYAGHGQLKYEDGFWVPINARSNLVSYYISNELIKRIIGNIRSQHTLLIADACFAGDIFRGDVKKEDQLDFESMNKFYQEIYRKPSRIALTSGGIEQVLDSGNEGHSIFMYYLLKALANNRNKFFSVEQLYDEFKSAVILNSDQIPKLEHLRDVKDEGGEFVFINNRLE
ncbi:MAG: caspase family protein [Candidatus Kariarchaeaceae archaeon]|jgi:hypothetical protein